MSKITLLCVYVEMGREKNFLIFLPKYHFQDEKRIHYEKDANRS